jgi:hypothetical protein
MKIQYSKIITDIEELKPHITETDSEYLKGSGLNGYCIRIEHDLKSLENTLLDGLEKEMMRVGFKTKKTGSNKLWVSEPEKFSLDINAKLEGNCYKTDSNKRIRQHWDLSSQKVERVGFMEKKGVWRTKECFLFKEVPGPITVKGNISYEEFGDTDPMPVLDILEKLGYESQVQTTPEDVQGLMDVLKKITNKK